MNQNKFSVIFLIIYKIISTESSIYVENIERLNFCEVQVFDNIFNIGRFIYFHRCGRFWVFIPDAKEGNGIVIEDYSFHEVVYGIEMTISKKAPNFMSKSIHAFSLKHIHCPINVSDTSPQSCGSSPFTQRDYTAIITENGYYSFYDDFYTMEPFERDQVLKGFRFKNFCPLNQVLQCNWFYPKIHTSEYRSYKSLLYDYDNKVMFAIIAYYNRHYLKVWKLEPILENLENFKALEREAEPLWSKSLFQFDGRPVGMFHYKNKNYVVGRINKRSRFADQVYEVKLINGQSDHLYSVDIIETTIGSDFMTLRTFFGCDPSGIEMSPIEPLPSEEDFSSTLLWIIVVCIALIIVGIAITVMYFVIQNVETDTTKSDSSESRIQ